MNKTEFIKFCCSTAVFQEIGFDQTDYNPLVYTHGLELPNYEIKFILNLEGKRITYEAQLINKQDGQIWNRCLNFGDFLFLLKNYQRYLRLRNHSCANDEDIRFLCDYRSYLTGYKINA